MLQHVLNMPLRFEWTLYDFTCADACLEWSESWIPVAEMNRWAALYKNSRGMGATATSSSPGHCRSHAWLSWRNALFLQHTGCLLLLPLPLLLHSSTIIPDPGVGYIHHGMIDDEVQRWLPSQNHATFTAHIKLPGRFSKNALQLWAFRRIRTKHHKQHILLNQKCPSI